MSDIQSLLDIMARLRAPEGGCPWDREQTYASLVRYTLEEAYEVAESIAAEDFDELRDELGDLLFQVVFYARIAEEEGRFDFGDVVGAIADKLTRRHPHVFGDATVRDARHQTAAWEQHKARERAARAQGPASALDGVALALPALVRAQKLQRRAARVGFDWDEVDGVIDKVVEELEECRVELSRGEAKEAVQEEVGDLLFACVNLARHAGVDAETALREASAKFERRFRAVEARLAAEGSTPQQAGLEAMDRHWDAIKAAEGSERNR